MRSKPTNLTASKKYIPTFRCIYGVNIPLIQSVWEAHGRAKILVRKGLFIMSMTLTKPIPKKMELQEKLSNLASTFNFYKGEKFYLRFSVEAPFSWKLLKIGSDRFYSSENTI